MNIVGKKVSHLRFGLGTIIEIDDNRVKVDFKSMQKAFIYPDCFEKFLTIQDRTTEKLIKDQLDHMHQVKKIILEQKKKEELSKIFYSKLKICESSQAAFGFQHNNLKQVLDTWWISTGVYLSGIHKGEPVVPKKLNMNSCCLLTMKPEGNPEDKRIILGMFMTKNDFIGADCESGIIYAHDKYRILWDMDQTELRFWDYASKKEDAVSWGKSEMKILSNIDMKNIIEDMIKLTKTEKMKDELLDFYDYYCEMNRFFGTE